MDKILQWDEFKRLDKKTAAALMASCCGAKGWVSKMMEGFPFESEKALVARATDAWYRQCTTADWLEAFTHHPKIGDIKSLEEKFSTTKHLAGVEQSGVADADRSVIQSLAAKNEKYASKFGFIFIVFATGKSAGEMLRLLEDRLHNKEEEELRIAMGEQHKITLLRLQKLMPDADWAWMKGSQITTHVLDTSIGKPGRNITIRLQGSSGNGGWQTIAQGLTNADGRIPDLLPPQKELEPANYKMVFDTAAYFEDQKRSGLYPQVDIQFTVFDNQHYHIPLLINPFGYSTYRGS
jgi:5-hydroxyisourate hydrolase/2-oxo-4-hydroxy-4-carboxy-5-ureidoimidazoline decarboxylase